MVDVAPFREQVREAWRTHTLGEISQATGVAPTTLHGIIHGDRNKLQVRTAARLRVGLPTLEER
jgi:hypothetical protein